MSETDERKNDAGAREQGVRTERSDDLSSPQLTAPAEYEEKAEQAEDDANDARESLRNSPPE